MMGQDMAHDGALIAVFLPLLGAALSYVLGRFWRARAGAWTGAAAVAVAAVMAARVLAVWPAGGVDVLTLGPWIDTGSWRVFWSVRIDALSLVMMTMVTSVSAMIHIYAAGYMEQDKSAPRFTAYLGLFTFFMLMLVAANDLLQLFLGWEGVGLCSYLLINFWFEKPAANAAGVKAFVVNRVGDVGFVLGIVGCLVVFGTVGYDDLFAALQGAGGRQALWAGVAAAPLIAGLLFVGAMGKSAQIGLHVWLPDAMEGPTPVSALIHAATMVTAGVFMLARLSPLYQMAPDILAAIAIIGAVTALFAASLALVQTDIKRVIAYSTMSQLGYMFVAAGLSAYGAAMFHLVMHAFFKSLLFLGAGLVIHAAGGQQDLRRMGGLSRRAPFAYATMWVGTLALCGVGVPGIGGLSGFYSKDLILEMAAIQTTVWGTWVYGLCLLTVALTAFYSLRLILLAFHGRAREVQHHAVGHHAPSRTAQTAMAAPLVGLGIVAVVGGFMTRETFVGSGRGAFWGSALPEGGPYDQIHHLGVAMLWGPLILTLLGAGVAYVMYVARPYLAEQMAQAASFPYRLLSMRYGIDDLYDRVFVRGADRLGQLCAWVGDAVVIDRLGPEGMARLAQKTGRRIGTLQSGKVYHYAFVMIAGLVSFITWFWIWR